MTALPPHLVCRKRWQRASELILARANVAEVSRQLELALFYDAKLTLRRSPNGGGFDAHQYVDRSGCPTRPLRHHSIRGARGAYGGYVRP
jgi:hypothetical protein